MDGGSLIVTPASLIIIPQVLMNLCVSTGCTITSLDIQVNWCGQVLTKHIIVDLPSLSANGRPMECYGMNRLQYAHPNSHFAIQLYLGSSIHCPW